MYFTQIHHQKSPPDSVEDVSFLSPLIQEGFFLGFFLVNRTRAFFHNHKVATGKKHRRGCQPSEMYPSYLTLSEVRADVHLPTSRNETLTNKVASFF